jgi:ribA/ribD-fused uncharacterized protein
MAATRTKVLGFYGHMDYETGFLSNFYCAPFLYTLPDYVKIYANKTVWVSHSEQAIMLTKAALFGDEDGYTRIVELKRPIDCKKAGRRVTPFCNTTWMAHVCDIAIHVLRQKFGQNPDICEALLDTAPNVLAEASPYDTLWGIGLRINNSKVQNPNEWRGTNILGTSLMTVRDEFAKQNRTQLSPDVN